MKSVYWLALIALAALAILAIQNPIANAEPTKTCGEFENATFNYRCDNNSLVFEACNNGVLSEHKQECISYCDPHALVNGVMRAACNNALEEEEKESQENAANQSEFELFTPNSCGDGSCQPPENCVNCPSDCSCSENAYCNASLAVCITPYCGDGECTENEFDSCCSDCGCETNEICDDYHNECVSTALLPTSGEAQVIALDYVSNETVEYTLESTTTYAFNKQSFITVTLDCESEHYDCFIIITIREGGEIASIAYSN